uniref:Knot1 domain-containing protein n=1 Tax=Caenorhabditis tropicalis TaxID=1561998 RepID=A0A1I7USK9_9PELO
MKLLVFFFILIALAYSRHIYEIVDEEEAPRRLKRGILSLFPYNKRFLDYGCGIFSSSSSECSSNCRNVFGCDWGRCEGKLRRFCVCKNEDNSNC